MHFPQKSPRTLRFLLFLLLWPSTLLAQTQAVTTNAGDTSAGSFVAAITTINGSGTGGAVSFAIASGSSITLTQPVPTASQSLTLTGNSVHLVNTSGNDTQILSSADFSWDTGVTFSARAGGGSPGSNGVSGVNGGNGGAAGNAGVTSLSSTMGVSASFVMNGGQGGAGGTGGAGANGGNGSDGGSVGVTIGSFTMSANSLFDVMGGLGGFGSSGVTSGNSGTGGSALVSMGSITTNTGSNFSVYGGSGNGGNVGGNGGAVVLNLGGVTMNGGSFTLQGGGGNGGNSASGTGGNVAVTISNMTMGTSANFLANGGSPGTVGGPGGNASVSINTLTMGTNDSFTVQGGSGGSASATIGSLTVGSSSSFFVSGTTSNASVSALSGSGSVSVGNLTLWGFNGGPTNNVLYGNTLLIPKTAYLNFNGTASFSAGISVVGGTFGIGVNSSSHPVLNANVIITNAIGPGVLWGYGQINGTVTDSGYVSPWGSSSYSGSLTITQFNETSTGVFQIGVAPGDNQSGSMIVSGAHLSGGLLMQWNLANFGFRDRYQILSGGPITGTFDYVYGVTGMRPYVIYGSNAVTLVLVNSGLNFTTYAHTPNQMAVGGVLNATLPTCGDAFFTKDVEIYNLLSGQDTVLDQLSGVIYTSLPNVLLDNLQFEDDLLFSRLGTGSQNSTAGPKAALAGNIIASEVTGPTSNAAKLGGTPSSGLWLQNTDSFGSVNATDNVIGFNKSNYGFLGGYDLEFSPGFTAGIMGGYLHTDLTQSDSSAKAGIDGIQGGLYGNKQFGNLDLGVVGGYTLDHFKVNRTITIGSDVNQVAGVYDGSQISGALQVDYRLEDVDTTIKPFAGIQYAHLSENAFTETGSDTLNLAIPAQSYDSIRPYIGLGETWTLGLGKDIQLVPGAHGSISQELGSTASQITTVFGGASGNPFTVTGITPAGTEFTVGGGLDLLVGKQFSLFANYNGHFSGSQGLNTFNGGVNLAF